MTEPSHRPRPPATRRPPGSVVLAAVLTAAMALGTVIPYVLAALGPLLIAAFDLSRLQFGFLPAVAFAVGGAGSLLLGALVDRSDARRVLLGLFAVAGLAHAITALARSYAVLLVAMVAAGVGLALVNPVTNLLVARLVAPGRRGTLIGVKQSGVQVGVFFTGATLPLLAVRFGWRWAVACVAAVALACALATVAAIGRQPPERAGDHGRAPLPGWVPWLAAYALLMGAGVAAAATYLPLYAHESLGMPVSAAGALLAVMGGVGVVTRVLWGVAAERYLPPSASLALLSAGAVLSQVLLWSAPATGRWAAWGGAAGLGATAVAWNAVANLAVVHDAGAATGRVSGIVQLAFYAGFVAAPLAFGWSVDATGGYAPGWAGVTLAFGLAGTVALRWHRVRSRGDGGRADRAGDP